MRRPIIFLTSWGVGLWLLPLAESAQAAGSYTAVYTAAQAEEGSALYGRQCAPCHGDDMEGGAGPALKGKAFAELAARQKLTAKTLLDVISRTMPMTAPASLKPEEYAALAAFIVRQSGYPAGSQTLSKASKGLGDTDLAMSFGADASTASAPLPGAIRVASSGVYSDAQASRGKSFYSDNCLQCHGGELDGVEDGPPLAGKLFMSKWGGLSVNALHAFIDRNMPPGNGGALGAVSEADVVAYILSRNNFPPGPTALPADPAGLNGIAMK